MRNFLRQILPYVAIYYGIVLGLDAVIFFFSHLPLKGHLDPVILRLGDLARFMVLPKIFLRHLWPGENTPTIFNYLLPLLNCVIWVAAFMGMKKLWIAVRK